MTDPSIREALSSAVAGVLESMFFLEALPEAAEPCAEDESVTVGVTFEGDPPGCFHMRIARRAAGTIAADFLGLDADSLTPQQSTDVTLELANMICGAVLSRIESSAIFRLGAPQIESGAGGPLPPAEETRYTVETGSGTLTVAIRMEAPICQATQESAF